MSEDKSTLITVRVPEDMKENLKEHLGDVSFKKLLAFSETLFDKGLLASKDGELFLRTEEDPLVEEFKSACKGAFMDYEYAMRKSINSIRRNRHEG